MIVKRRTSILMDFSLEAPGGSKTYGRGFLAALGKAAPTFDAEICVLLAAGGELEPLASGLSEGGVEVVVVDEGGSAGGWRSRLSAQVRLPRALIRHRPAVVFVPREAAPLAIGRARLVVLARNVLIWRSGRPGAGQRSQRGLAQVTRRIVARVAVLRSRAVLAPSQAIAGMVPTRRVTVVPYGTELERPAPPETPMSTSRVRLVAIGTLSPHKRFDVAIELCGALKSQYGIESTLQIWGPEADGVEAARLREIARRVLGDDEVIRGALAFASRGAVLAEADVLVVCSGQESFGFPMVEAMASGVLVLGPRSDIVSEICGGVAVTYDEGRPESAARNLVAVLGEESTELVREGLQRSDLFSWERCVERTVGVLLDVASE